jgi:hypothetical protein
MDGEPMNKVQQEIKGFHEKLKPILEKILDVYNGKNSRKIYNTVIRRCKNLQQKCSFKSTSDIGSLCTLAYWLYIYGHKQIALEICELTHGMDFGYEYGGSHSGIINIYGLEIRIARELLGEKRHSIIPSKAIDYFCSKAVKKSIRYPRILRKEEVEKYGITASEYYLHSSLYDMIGKGETGLYTELNENWAEIEETIILYTHILGQV